MKFAIINDSHIGPENSGSERGIQRKLVAQGKKLLAEFIAKMNGQEKPEFVVNLGDSIEDVNDRNIDIQSFKKVLALFSKLIIPVYFLIGNHDVRTLTQEEIAKILRYHRHCP